MLGILTGFVAVLLPIALGYLLGRLHVLRYEDRFVLSKLVFYLLGPLLIFVVVGGATAHDFASSLLWAYLCAVAVTLGIYLPMARYVWRRNMQETTIGSVGAAYVNVNNIGIPIATYVIGDGSMLAPIIVFQLTIVTPLSLFFLTSGGHAGTSRLRMVLTSLVNPTSVAAWCGLAVALSGIELPQIVMMPLEMSGAACIPVMLISYGLSLAGQRFFVDTSRSEVATIGALKLLVMPLSAVLVGAYVFGMRGDQLFTAFLIGALPSAQYTVTFAQQFSVAESTARNAVFVTTFGSMAVLLIAAVLVRTLSG